MGSLDIFQKIKYKLLKPYISYKQNKFSRLYLNKPVHDIICKFNGIKIRLRSNSVLAKPLYVGIGFEDAEIKFLKKNVKPGMTVLDIGANVGLYTIIMAKIAGSKGRVYSFEPYCITNNYLNFNVSLNNLHNVQVEEMALANIDGKEDFFIFPDGEDVYNSIGAKVRSEEKIRAEQIVKVPISKLDSYCYNQKIYTIDFLKMDVEGAEEKVFEGGIETFKKMKPIIMTEIYEPSAIQCGCSGIRMLKKFNSIGYKAFSIISQAKLEILKDYEKLVNGTHYVVLYKG